MLLLFIIIFLKKSQDDFINIKANLKICNKINFFFSCAVLSKVGKKRLTNISLSSQRCYGQSTTDHNFQPLLEITYI